MSFHSKQNSNKEKISQKILEIPKHKNNVMGFADFSGKII